MKMGSLIFVYSIKLAIICLNVYSNNIVIEGFGDKSEYNFNRRR